MFIAAMPVTNNNCSPRDLGLLRWQAGCHVPLEITNLADVLETARRHCKMRPERLEVLQEDYPEQWEYAMNLIQRNRAKRAAGYNLRRQPRITRDDPERYVASIMRRKGIIGLLELI